MFTWRSSMGMLLCHSADHRLYAVGLADVENSNRRQTAGCTNSIRCRFEVFSTPAREYDVHAERCEQLCDAESDACHSAGDDADLSRQQTVSEDGRVTHRPDPAVTAPR